MVSYEAWLNELEMITNRAKGILDAHENTTLGAVVFDIDDTLISSHTGEIIGPVLDLFQFAVNSGMTVVIVTSRVGTPRAIEYTVEQLKQLGIRGHSRLYMRKTEETNNWSFKRASRKSVYEDGYNILMSVGDMDWDFTNGYTGVGVQIPRWPGP